MRTFFLFMAGAIIFGCTKKKPVKQATLFYYVNASERNESPDTISYEELRHADKADRMLSDSRFVFNHTRHAITAYTSDDHAPVDGGRIYYTLDTLGVIYSGSTTWPVFQILQSNNDSINRLIAHALGHIVLHPDLRCYHCNEVPVKYIAPVESDH